jgi:pentatricopeptide repeat protein
MLECAVQAESLEKMKEIFEEAIANFDAAQQADLITYSTYIKGLCKLGKIKEALKIYNTLRE